MIKVTKEIIEQYDFTVLPH